MFPAVVKVREQETAGRVRMQLSRPDEMVTVPVGVPLEEVTLTDTATAMPTSEEFERSLVMLVVVAAGRTVCEVPALALGSKLLSPAKLAVMILLPALLKVRVQEVAGRVMVQVFVPEETVTMPVGVPPAEVTLTVTNTV